MKTIIEATASNTWEGSKMGEINIKIGHVIIIPSYSISVRQELLAPVMPPTMKHKIGL